MSKLCLLFSTIALGAAASACGSGGATAPSPSGDYAGEWSGTTMQGRSMSFSVSADQKVTSMTVGYNFNGCSGTNTFSNLSLDIGIGPSGFPPRVPTPSNPGFGYGSGSPEAPNYTQVVGTFTSSRAAAGSATLLNVTNCGNAVTNWSATKR